MALPENTEIPISADIEISHSTEEDSDYEPEEVNISEDVLNNTANTSQILAVCLDDSPVRFQLKRKRIDDTSEYTKIYLRRKFEKAQKLLAQKFAEVVAPGQSQKFRLSILETCTEDSKIPNDLKRFVAMYRHSDALSKTVIISLLDHDKYKKDDIIEILDHDKYKKDDIISLLDHDKYKKDDIISLLDHDKYKKDNVISLLDHDKYKKDDIISLLDRNKYKKDDIIEIFGCSKYQVDVARKLKSGNAGLAIPHKEEFKRIHLDHTKCEHFLDFVFTRGLL